MATDRRILRIDQEAQAQQRIAAALSGGLIVAAEGNLLYCRDTKALYYIEALSAGSYPLTPVNAAGTTEALARAEAVATALQPLTEGDALIVLPRLDGTARLLIPDTIRIQPATVTLRGRVLTTIVLTTK